MRVFEVKVIVIILSLLDVSPVDLELNARIRHKIG